MKGGGRSHQERLALDKVLGEGRKVEHPKRPRKSVCVMGRNVGTRESLIECEGCKREEQINTSHPGPLTSPFYLRFQPLLSRTPPGHRHFEEEQRHLVGHLFPVQEPRCRFTTLNTLLHLSKRHMRYLCFNFGG